MIMRRQSFRRWFVSALVLGGCLATLAVVSGGRAGSGPGASTYGFSAQPRYLTVLSDGLAQGVFTAALDSGAVTHLTMIFEFPQAAMFTVSKPSNCSGPTASPDHLGYDRYTCALATLNAGQTVKQFLKFTAQELLGEYRLYSFSTFDKGSGGAPGAGGANRIPATGYLEQLITVVAATDTRRAGKCLSADYNISTPVVSAADVQGTSLAFGPAAFFVPCTAASLGEDPAPSGFTIPYISFVSAPVFANLATLTISIYQLPLSKIGTLYEFPNYPDLSFPLEVLACPSPTSLPPNPSVTQSSDACELPRSKKGNVTFLTLLYAGTGGDPGYGGG